MAQPQGLIDFENGTRRRTIQANPIPFVDGTPQSLRLQNVGLLSRIRVKVHIRFTTNAAGVFANDAIVQKARAALRRVVLSTGMSSDIVSCSAHGLGLLSITSAPSSYSSYVLSSERVSAPAAAGVHDFFFDVDVPVALNDGSNYTLGLVNLQNDDVSLDLRLEWANFRNLFADGGIVTAVEGRAYPELTYYDVPDISVYSLPPLDYLVQTREQIDSVIIGTGEHVYNVPKGNVLLKLIQQFTEDNGLCSLQSPINQGGKIRTHELRMQNTTTDYVAQAYMIAEECRRRYGIDIPDGTIILDHLWDTNKAGQFDLGYQLLDTQSFTMLDTRTNVAGLNSATSKLRTVYQEIVRIQG